ARDAGEWRHVGCTYGACACSCRVAQRSWCWQSANTSSGDVDRCIAAVDLIVRPIVGIVIHQRMLQQQSSLSPIPLYGALRRSAKLGDLRKCEAAEKVQVHQLCECGIEHRELLDRITESLQLPRSCDRLVRRLFILGERDLELAAAFERTPA